MGIQERRMTVLEVRKSFAKGPCSDFSPQVGQRPWDVSRGMRIWGLLREPGKLIQPHLEDGPLLVPQFRLEGSGVRQSDALACWCSRGHIYDGLLLHKEAEEATGCLARERNF